MVERRQWRGRRVFLGERREAAVVVSSEAYGRAPGVRADRRDYDEVGRVGGRLNRERDARIAPRMGLRARSGSMSRI